MLSVQQKRDHVSKEFHKIIGLVSGEMLKDIKQDPAYLLEISEHKQIVDAICVKLVNNLNSINESDKKQNVFFNTFRVYERTKFEDLKKAACTFWHLKDQAYILTDECFNNLAPVQETVLMFF